MAKKRVTVYTDGACSNNPGPGGYGIVLIYGAHKREYSAGYTLTTNNRMELLGVITALSMLTEPCEIDLFTDSKYVVSAFEQGWIQSWRANGWKKADKKPVLNVDLWQMLLSLCEMHDVHFNWVKGHAENEYNNRCDELAVEAAKNPTFEDLGYEEKGL